MANQTYAGWQPGDIVRFRKAGKRTYRLTWVGRETVTMENLNGWRSSALGKDLERVATAENIAAGDPAHAG